MADPVGIEARGRAGVFGQATNPLQFYLSDRAVQQKRADALMEREREQRDKLVEDLRKWNPDEVWQPFYSEINDDVQRDVRDRFTQLRTERQSLPAIDREMQRAYGDVNTKVAKINWLKQQWTDAMDTVDSNDIGKYYKKNQTKRAVNDIFFNGRVAKRSEEINADQVQDVFDNPDNFDINAVSIDFMKSLPEKVNQKYTEYWGKYGQQYDVTETKTKLGLQFTQGPDGRESVVLDPRTNLPKISMTDEVYLQAMQNDFLNKVVEKYVPDGNIQEQKEFLTGILEGLDPVTIQSRPQMGFRRPEDEIRYNAFGRGFRFPIADLEDRDDRLEKIVNDNRPELLQGLSDPQSDDQAYYGDKDGNPIKAGQKPETVVLAYVGQPADGEMDMSKWADMKLTDKLLYQQARGRIVKESILPINNAEQKRRTKIAMSLRLDAMDKKRSIGEEYSNYVEAKYQDQLKQRKNSSGLPQNFWKKPGQK